MQLPASILLTALVTGRPTRRDFLPFDYIFWDTQERYYSGQVLPYLRVLFDDSPVSLEDKGDICRKYHQNFGLSGTGYPRGRGRRIVMDRKVCQEGERAGGSVVCFPECFLQGYVVKEAFARGHAMNLASAAFTQVLQRLADLSPMLVFGLMEEEFVTEIRP